MSQMGKALVVDWSFMVAETIGDALGRLGYESLAETHYEGALRELRADPTPTLLVVHGGRHNDAEALDFLTCAQLDFPDVPMVIISGMTRREIAIPAGRWVHVQKPFDMAQLLTAIDTASSHASECSTRGRLFDALEQPPAVIGVNAAPGD
jgi:DNA-binding NtrC family response regulator